MFVCVSVDGHALIIKIEASKYKIDVKHQLKFGISLAENNLNISFTRKYVEITLL